MSDINTGNWTPYHTDLSDEAQKIFKEAMEGQVGVEYNPIAYATQVVSGTNYSFFCNAKGVFPQSMFQGAIIDVYNSLDKKPTVKDIRIIKP